MRKRISSPVFVGRQGHLERLEVALEAAAAGRPALVLVAGEAGVGKSRLVAELSARARSTGARVLAGGCLDLGEGGLPFAPFVEALKDLVKALGLESETAVRAVFGQSDQTLIRLVPDLRNAVPDGEHAVGLPDHEGRRGRLFDAVLDVLGRLSATSPVLLILEDLHWADGSTRDLLRFLLRNIRDERVLMVGTFRSDDLHRRHPLMRLLAELERSDQVERLDVMRLDREEIVELATAILGHPPAAAIVDSVAERSDGLPFYVEELLAMETPGGELPGSVRDIVGQSLAALPDESVALVGAAAVIGGRFPLDRLAAVAGLDDAALLPALRGAIDARVIIATDGADGPAYAFRHALLREAAYEELLPADRVRLHARLADLLAEQLAGTVSDDAELIADLAVHTFHAGDQPRALKAAVRAAQALAGAGAIREALVHAEHALQLWPRVDDAEAHAGLSHGGLLTLAGQVGAGAGELGPALAHASAALDELEPSASPERLAAALIDVYDIAMAAEAFDTAWPVAKRLGGLIDQLPASRLRIEALIVAGDERWSTGHLQEADALAAQALATAEALNDDRLWEVAALEVAAGLATSGRAGRAEALFDEAASRSRGFDGSGRQLLSAISGCWVRWHAGRFEDSARLAADARRAALRYGVERRYERWFLANEAHAIFELGQFEACERLAQAVGEHRFLGMWTLLAKIEALRGHPDAARAALRTSDLWNSPLWRLETQIYVDRAAGDFGGVRADVDAAETERRNSDIVSAVWRLLGTAVGAAADQAQAARRRRRVAEAAEANRLGGRWLGQLREIVADGRADGGAGRFCEATLATAEAEGQRLEGRVDPSAWSRAADQWRALSSPLETAYAEARLGEALLAVDGDRAEIVPTLQGAHAAATSLGAVPLRREIETIARHARIDLTASADAPTGPSDDAPPSAANGPALTARERDVLRLVADGHTNREIGDQLYIAEKTASVHVSNAMSKLGALSRYEAAAMAERTGQLG